MKNCNKCNSVKPFDAFELRSDTGKYRNACKFCVSEFKKKNYIKNSNKILQKQKVYRQNNKDKLREIDKNKYFKYKDKILQKMKIYRNSNELKIKMQKSLYYQNNKKMIKNKSRLYRSNNKTKRNINRLIRIRLDLNFKIRENISANIRNHLNKNNSSKNGESCLKYLPYTISNLKLHLESKFESWMNWNNWGRYNSKTWNDQDPVTWTWQIDHIVPHSTFKYTNMEEENFKKCWALENLRPLSARQNVIEGSNKIRHIGENNAMFAI